MLRNNPKNPYNTTSYLSTACGYCNARIGQWCVVKGTSRRAYELHDSRYDMKRAAYDAWEKGRMTGRAEITAAMELAVELIKKADEPKADLKSVG